jgi:putative ATP-dependent endonuclease of OLD family
VKIRGVKLAHFRGIEQLTWFPGPGINALVGPGDVGKTTVLDAIEMVLSPAPSWVASEHDYHRGDTSKPFRIDLLVGNLDADILRSWPVAPIWSWNSMKRTVQAAPDPILEAVVRIGVHGSEQLEISHFALDPSGGELALSPATRRKFGLSTLGSPAGGLPGAADVARVSALTQSRR